MSLLSELQGNYKEINIGHGFEKVHSFEDKNGSYPEISVLLPCEQTEFKMGELRSSY